jgi:hypothetical protein
MDAAVALWSAKFREVVKQVTAALEDRGISVPEPGVAEIVEERARQVAEQAGMSVRQVLEHAESALDGHCCRSRQTDRYQGPGQV